KRVGHAGHRVGRSWPRGDDRTSGLAADAPVAIGRVRRDLLVADVDYPDALVEAAVVDVDNVAAAEREDRIDALVAQRLGNEVAAGDPGARGGRLARRAFHRSFSSSCHGRSPRTSGRLQAAIVRQSSASPTHDRTFGYTVSVLTRQIASGAAAFEDHPPRRRK